ncbi:hypothetical protein YK48G_17360 [Lentilactobacillus fungorum]|uniref:HTH cro/C1-type domain-containing protein n=1 Tax=Lentilactobacillus fungorum TaxID=2201250 RepID=A0ABQ3W1J7_9LACO|nr:helix-turn-helix transcriptional regulator [Lentilactobacillus fungorum]GHP14311.1 hypothetical protein YK48G_17360 [Lentilactobacillus fungorum]
MSEYPPLKYKNRIKQLRTRDKLTQKQLATKFNEYITTKRLDVKPVSYATISRWEKNISQPRNESIEALASLFHVSPLYVSGLQNEPWSGWERLDTAVQSTDFSDPEAAKKTLNYVVLVLSSQIDELQERVRELENPNSDYDPYG